VLRTLACALCAAACLLAGCGGSGTDASKLATATPRTGADTPRGIDVAAVNRARDAFVAACKARDTGDGSGPLNDARQAAATLVRELRKNPDAKFRRSPKAPAVTMRDRVRAVALIARTACGDRDAARLGDRLARAASHARS
jgi:hypothetical protein